MATAEGWMFVLTKWINTNIFVCKLMREVLRRKDHKGQKEKKVGRNSVWKEIWTLQLRVDFEPPRNFGRWHEKEITE